jgi:hypothetical protein
VAAPRQAVAPPADTATGASNRSPRRDRAHRIAAASGRLIGGSR